MKKTNGGNHLDQLLHAPLSLEEEDVEACTGGALAGRGFGVKDLGCRESLVTEEDAGMSEQQADLGAEEDKNSSAPGAPKTPEKIKIARSRRIEV